MKFFPLLLAAFAAAAAAASPGLALGGELRTPAPADSQCPNLAAAPDGTLHLTWCGPSLTIPGERALFVAALAPGATAWSAPHTIVSAPQLMESTSDFPSLVVGTDGALTAQWFIRHGASRHDYDGWFARSTDHGATWTKPASLGNEFVALAPLSGGRTLAVWLARIGPAHSAHAAHGASPTARDPHAPSPPAMQLLARLLAPDGTSLGEWTVDPDVCTCCQNTAAVLPGDRVFIGYRGHSAADIRDNKFARFDLRKNSWSAPQPIHDDGWKIAACPVNGPAADARGDALAVAWFTVADGVARVQAKYSADAGRTFGAPVALDLGRPMGRLETVLLPDRSALFLWAELGTPEAAGGIYARRLFADGKLSTARLVADSARDSASGFPRAAVRPSGHVVIAFTQAGKPNQVRTLELDPGSLARPGAVSSNVRPSTFRPAAPLVAEFCIAPVGVSPQLSSQ